MSPAMPSLWSFVAEASPIVKMVLIILIACSIASWTIILQRHWLLHQVKQASGKFVKRFWQGMDLQHWFTQWQATPQQHTGNGYVIAAGLDELHKLKTLPHLNSQARLQAIERRMQAAQGQFIGGLQNALSFLATVGSTSPYIGLFGTVWGIMSSFRALGQANQATLAMVAPGIAEALIATAFGLFAAIPAVIAYNRFNAQINKLDDEYLQLQQNFLSLTYRQLEQQVDQQMTTPKVKTPLNTAERMDNECSANP